MNFNENFKNVKNTLLSQVSVNKNLSDDLSLSNYGIFSSNPSVFSYPFTPNYNAFEATITLEQLLRAKNNAYLMGLLVNITENIPTPLFLPVNDTSEGAFTLIKTLNLLNPGD